MREALPHASALFINRGRREVDERYGSNGVLNQATKLPGECRVFEARMEGIFDEL